MFPPGPHPSAPGALPSTPDGSASLPTVPRPAPTGPRLPAKLRLPLLVAGSLLVAGLLGGGITCLVLRGRGDELGALLDRAPGGTVAAATGRLRGDLPPADAKRSAVQISSLAARLCGTLDLVTVLDSARGLDWRAVAALGLESLSQPERLAEGLKCGSAFAQARQGAAMAQLGFLDGDRPRSVVAVKLKASAGTPAGLAEASFGARRGLCTKAGSADDAVTGTACAKSGVAGFEDAGSWYAGSFEDLSAFAAAYRSEGRGGGAAEAGATLARLARELRGADSVQLRFRPESIDLAVPCAAAAPPESLGEFLGRCLPQDQPSDGRSIAVELKASALLQDLPESARSVGFEYVLWARSADSAASAERKLRSWVQAWQGALAQNDAELGRMLGASTDPSAAAWRAVARSWLDAVKKPAVERDGDMVRLKIRRELSDDDVAALRPALEARTKALDEPAAVVEAVLGGKPVPRDTLAAILGRNNADWILSPPASPADCRAIGDHAKKLGESPEGMGELPWAAEEVDKSWRADCGERHLTAEARACLLGAGTIEKMLGCPVPVSPDAAALQRYLQGTWQTNHHLPAAGRADWELQNYHSMRLVIAGSSFVLSSPYREYVGMEGPLGLVRIEPLSTGVSYRDAIMRVGVRRLTISIAWDKVDTGDVMWMHTYDGERASEGVEIRLSRTSRGQEQSPARPPSSRPAFRAAPPAAPPPGARTIVRDVPF